MVFIFILSILIHYVCENIDKLLLAKFPVGTILDFWVYFAI